MCVCVGGWVAGGREKEGRLISMTYYITNT